MDTDLVTRAQHGDKDAFAVLAAARADRFLATSRRILRDLDLAEDATQQARMQTPGDHRFPAVSRLQPRALDGR